MRTLTLPDCQIPPKSLSFLPDWLALTQQRVDQLDQLRMERALHHADAGFRLVLAKLPLLLHYNQADLLAYSENAPYGIAHYQPDENDAAELGCPLIPTTTPAFDALYMMGSTGSITQNGLSDLDLWLCHSQSFSPLATAKLHEKLHHIQCWAKQQGVDLNFYLMNPNEFRAKKYHSEVTPEHSGSAQHYFLLDEFYRSAIRLAGKRVLWLHLPELPYSYERSVALAVAHHYIQPDDWIDFGDFSSLPLGEYFGASLWQLYKGIDHPYKSAIKILLLESYAETYPETPLISKQFKRLLHAAKGGSYHFDPYLAMLEQVTTYLQKRKEFHRLECLRSCFYIKAMEQQQDPWKRQALLELSQSWGWQDAERQLLAERQGWKVKQAMRHQQMLVEQLLQSYRNLLNFARKTHIDPNILPQDTDVLMRKLYSAFEVFPGKVVLINEKIAHHLAEADVTFVEVGEHCATKSGWYLINHAPLSAYDSTKRYVQYHRSLNKLVAWAYFNGIVTVNTQIHLVSQTVSLARLRQFITDLRLHFPAKPPQMTSDDLYHPNEIRNLIVAVNLTQDPTQKLTARPDLSQVDLFNLNRSDHNIIGSISIIYRNMWNEIITQHIEGHDSILKALKLISNKIYRSSAPPQSVNVFCYAAQLRREIQQVVLGLVNRCITVQTGVATEQKPHTFNFAGRKWQLVFGKQLELKAYQEQGEVPPLTVPKAIYSFASEGFLQFFFEDNADHSFNVYVLDKQNKLEVYANCVGEKAYKIRQISRLYAKDEQQRGDCLESFNYPQFYQLLAEPNQITIVPFQSKQHRDYQQRQFSA